jgi:eukaryotic-like serine/threonine-protein kinase
METGSRLGPYEIVAPIGAGGMGEVYRARDSRLGRDVAIKILPRIFSDDPDRRSRFEREARVLAALNHPHIAAIHGFEEADGVGALVLELVEGPTLEDRLRQGALPVRESIAIARQIAAALEAAHEKGIIHRDLKPANVKVTAADGTVKLLDFGLAKALEPKVEPGVSQSPTLTADGTRVGVVLGTAAYMSPEQTRGQAVDKRADIWSFGCVLFEMLAGRRPFPGQTISETVAAIIGDEPDWAALPADLPPRVSWLLRRCLEKDLKRRLHDIADARIELDDEVSDAGRTRSGAVPGAPAARAAGPSTNRTREKLAWIAAGLSFAGFVAVLALGRGSRSDSDADVATYNTSIVLQDELRTSLASPAGRFALSPDGRRLAVVATDLSGRTMLWIRPLDTIVAQPLAGTEDATFPFWSPDSRFIAFVSQNKLKKIDVTGGPPVTICDADIAAPGAWNRDNVILFTPKGSSPLFRVSASGGTPAPVTTLDAGAGDAQHWYPSFLPDGRHFLYFVVGSKQRGMTDPRAINIGSLDAGEPSRELIAGGSNARYANGHIVYLREGTLVAHAFDAERLELSGEPVPLVEDVQIAGAGSTGVAGAFSLSDTGLLAYQTGFAVRSELAWFDRSGARLTTLGDQADYADVSLSPDDSRVAVSILDLSLGSRDVWLYDIARGTRERFTFDRGDDFAPVWARPGGDRLVFSSRRLGAIHLYEKPARGAGAESLLLQDPLGKFASHWSADGRFITYIGGGGIIVRSDLWVLPLAGDRKPFPFLDTTFVESQSQFSPDGRWMAYMSNESGRQEVYVRPFPGPGDKWLVSTAGGGWPRWRRDGREIFYVARDGNLMAVSVNAAGSSFVVGAGRPLFKVRMRPMVRLDAYSYDVTADGQRFLINTFVEEATPPAITLVVNWPRSIQ